MAVQQPLALPAEAVEEVAQPRHALAVTGAEALPPETLQGPAGVLIDTASNRVFIADHENNRVLVFPTSSTTGLSRSARSTGRMAVSFAV